jgi:hypothetical protein
MYLRTARAASATLTLSFLLVLVGGCSKQTVERGAESEELLREKLDHCLRIGDVDSLRLLHYSVDLQPGLHEGFVKKAEQFREIRTADIDGVHPIHLRLAGLQLEPTPTGCFLVPYPTNVLPRPLVLRFGKAKDGRWYLCTFVAADDGRITKGSKLRH